MELANFAFVLMLLANALAVWLKDNQPMTPELHKPYISDDRELEKTIRKLAGLARVLKYVTWVFISVMFVALAEDYFGLLSKTINYDINSSWLIIIMGIAVYLTTLPQKKLDKHIYRNLIVRALSEVFQDLEYRPMKHIEPAWISSTALIGRWNKYRGSDLIKGKYRGVKIAFSDIRFTEKKRSGATFTKISKFQGQWLSLELRKEIPAPIHLRERYEYGEDVKSDVKTENAAFNQKYWISTSDPYTAFFLLTPHFIEYIVNMDEKTGTRTCMSVISNRVDIALHNTRDLFEVSGTKRLRTLLEDNGVVQLRRQICDDINYITGIIDELLLNDYLFGDSAN